MNEPLLIGDIGGTNARFAIADSDSIGIALERTYKCADFASVIDVIRFYLEQTGVKSPKSLRLAVAGPVVNEQVSFTNNPWLISASELLQAFGAESVKLLNDFEAIAYSIPFISIEEVLPFGVVNPSVLDMPDFTIAVIGPGTGLGAAGLRKQNDQYTAIVGEASHGGFAPESQEQIEILAVLRERFERVSNERLVSGPGLENLYWSLAQIQGEKRPQISAREIFLAGINESDSIATKAIGLFYEILGQVAGDLALSLGADDGVYIAGGIAQRYPQQLINSRFRRGFENKGRHRLLMERIPTQVITHKQPGLLGALCY